MPYSAQEQALYDHLKATLPRFLFQKSTAPEEIWGAFVKLYDRVRQEVDTWVGYTFILEATGIWLNQHAIDRGTFRQASEGDSALQQRLKTIEDMVTRPAILERINTLMDEVGPDTPDAVMVEVRRDRGFFQESELNGAGDSFAGPVSSVMTLTDAGAKFLSKPGLVGCNITISGATTGANNGTFPITEVVSDTVIKYTNAAGVAESFPGTWSLVGRKRAYLSRGYRMGSQQAHIVVILPFGTSAGTANAVREYLRTHKAAGYRHSVEVRGVP